jgi:predicted nucleotide-binding protein
MIKELKLLSEVLWTSLKSDLKFFAPIQVFVQRLAETDFSDPEQVKEKILMVEKIDDYFDLYRSKPNSGIYFPPGQISSNDKTVKDIFALTQKLKSLSPEDLAKEIASIKPAGRPKAEGGGHIFVGHGRSPLWARLELYLKNELKLQTLSFESESRTSETIINILESFLDKSSYAILIMTGEDDTLDGKTRARQNVIHEAGLFQGRLGFDKVIILKQAEIEEFTNIAGLQYISFTGDEIEQTFYQLGRALKKIGLIKSNSFGDL